MEQSGGGIETTKMISFTRSRKLSSNPLQGAERARDWLLLPDDITKNIILKVELTDIFEHVQFVCKSWYRLCKQPDMWRFVDFIVTPWLWEQYPFISDPWIYRSFFDELRLRAISRSSDKVVAITVETWDHGHMWKIAQRSSCSSLERLTLFNYLCRFSTVEKALANLPSLQVFEAIWCYFLEDVIETLGTYGQSLHTLRWYPSVEARGGLTDHYANPNYEAFAIAKHLPKLRHLSLYANPLDNQGLLAILDGCRQLESLDLRKCYALSLTNGSVLLERCKRINQVWLPDDLNLPGAFDYKPFEEIVKQTVIIMNPTF